MQVSARLVNGDPSAARAQHIAPYVHIQSVSIRAPVLTSKDSNNNNNHNDHNENSNSNTITTNNNTTNNAHPKLYSLEWSGASSPFASSSTTGFPPPPPLLFQQKKRRA